MWRDMCCRSCELEITRAWLVSHSIIHFHQQVYVTEIAEKSNRGALGSLFQLQITGGILLVYIIAAIASAKTTSLICGILSIVFLALVSIIPESPNYFVRNFHYMQCQL